MKKMASLFANIHRNIPLTIFILLALSHQVFTSSSSSSSISSETLTRDPLFQDSLTFKFLLSKLMQGLRIKSSA